MATTAPLFRTPIYFILMVVFGISLASPGEHPGVLSRLYKQASKQNRPLIIVLDNSAHDKTEDVHYKANGELDKKVSLPLMYMYQLDQSQKKSQPMEIPISKLLENGHEKLKKRLVKKRVKHRPIKKSDDKRFLESPVIKSLLRISKSLRCDAKDDCEDECNDKYNGEKREECIDQCSCEDSVEETQKEEDECEDTNSSEALQMSTQGERLITVTPKYKDVK